MLYPVLSPRYRALRVVSGLILVTWSTGVGWSQASQGNGSPASQPALPSSSPQSGSTVREELGNAELVAAYHSVRDQLRATQAALLSERADADERARTQTFALNQKLESLRASLVEVNKRQQDDAARAEYELFRQQEAARQASRLALWIASAIGLAVLIGSLITANLLRRAMNRIADAVNVRPLLPSHAGWLPLEAGIPSDQSVTAANQRLASALERIEQRIQDLEETGLLSPNPERRPAPAHPAPRRL